MRKKSAKNKLEQEKEKSEREARFIIGQVAFNLETNLLKRIFTDLESSDRLRFTYLTKRGKLTDVVSFRSNNELTTKQVSAVEAIEKETKKSLSNLIIALNQLKEPRITEAHPLIQQIAINDGLQSARIVFS